MLGVNARGKKEVGEGRKGSTRRGHAKKGLKVVYISSPMMVKTSAAEFRSTVQELTGRDSDVSRIMDSGDWYQQNQEEEAEGLPRHRSEEDRPQNSNQSFGSSYGSPNYFVSLESDSPSESDSLFQDMGGLQHHRDVDVYTSSLFQDSTLLEVIGSFDLY